MILFNSKKGIDFWFISLIFFFGIKLSTSLLITKFFGLHLNNTVIDNISNKYFTFLLSILIAPVIETFILFKLVLMGFDYLEQLKLIGSHKLYLFMLTSSLLFSINHCFNISYLINGFVSGILYSFIYYKSYISKNYPFIGTALIHSLYNLFVFYWKF